NNVFPGFVYPCFNSKIYCKKIFWGMAEAYFSVRIYDKLPGGNVFKINAAEDDKQLQHILNTLNENIYIENLEWEMFMLNKNEMMIYRNRKLEHAKRAEIMNEKFAREVLNTRLEIQQQTMQHIGREIHDN